MIARSMTYLDDIARDGDHPEVALAPTSYRQALAVAEALDMRPLQAHCHLSLGTLYAKNGQQEQAGTELSTAMVFYCAIGITFWLPHIEVGLADEQIRIASSPSFLTCGACPQGLLTAVSG